MCSKMAGKMKIWFGSGSMPCWRPMIVLEEKGLDYERKLISFSNKEHKSEEILKLNQRGQVPTFQDGDIVICESSAICDYLERSYPDSGNKLIPTEKKQSARVLQRMHEVLANMNDKCQRNLMYYLYTEETPDEQTIIKNSEIARGEYKIWEEYLTGEEYLAGSEFSMADVYFFPFIAYGVRCGLKLEPFPNIKGYYDRIKERPSMKNTWPPHWLTDEPSEKFKSVYAKV